MPAKRPPKSVKPAQCSETASRILAVDDDENVRFTYSRLLTKAGYQVQTASSGEEGLRLLEQSQYDLVILDLKMPGMDGVEFLRRLRGLKGRPEVLVVSGYATTEATVEVVKLGAFDVAQKPCLSGDLLPRVERMLARHREPVVEYIRANFATIRSREEVARHFRVSPGTISNRVREHAGHSFDDFLRSCRIQEAQRLLAETDLDIQVIAPHIGFNSRQAFYRTFHQSNGGSPCQYRRNCRLSK